MTGTEFRARDWAIALLLALAFKQFYAGADEGQLQWLLRPLAWLLGLVSDLSFLRQPGGEWLDADHGLAIVKACAGGNFLIASWLGWLWHWRDRPFGPALVAQAVAAAWLTTLVANALRIVLIAYGQDPLAHSTGLSDADSHRLIGIGVYFGALSMQMAGALPAAVALYLGVTLVLPWLHAVPDGIDAGHAAWTAGPPLAMLAAYAVWRALHCRHDRKGQPA